jgi:hypothetical protein
MDKEEEKQKKEKLKHQMEIQRLHKVSQVKTVFLSPTFQTIMISHA